MKHHAPHHSHKTEHHAHKTEHHAHHAKPAEQKAEVYVGIPDVVAVRKPLLEAARLSVLAGASQQKLIDIQDRKLAIRTNLSQVAKDMRTELARLKMVLPHRDVPLHPSESHPVDAPKKPVEHRVDKIAAALAAIEERMKQL